MYEIVLLDGSVQWFNERIIMKIIAVNDGETYILYHFNDSKVEIKNFRKL